MKGAILNSTLSVAAGNDVLLQQELERIGDRLRPAVPAADIHRAQPVLHVRGDLPFQPDQEKDEQRQKRENEDAAHQRRAGSPAPAREARRISVSVQELRDGFHPDFPCCYRSISPSTMSTLPRMATMSAIMAPRLISRKALMTVKQGDFTLTR